MSFVRLVKAGAGVLLLGALGGCGSSGTGSGGAAANGLTNGCDAAMATDMTSQSTVSLTWSLPHNECILIKKGTKVTWTGDFQVHPLAGGITPDQDPASPITSATPANGQVSVTFANAGEYPYFCVVHTSQMEGVVYVE
jgi:plastocyanin